MADTDANAESQSCERIQCVRNNSEDDIAEWVKVNWPKVETNLAEFTLSNEDNCGYHADESRSDVTSYTVPSLQPENDDANQRQQSEDATASEDIEPMQAQSEESDDISIITDSDIEIDAAEDALNVTFQELCRFKGNICGPLRMRHEPIKQPTQGGILLNLIIACSLGVVIGLAVSKIFFVADTCSISSGIDVETIREESNNIINHMKELNDVKRVLDQIKESMPTHRKISRHQKKKFLNKYGRSSKGVKILDINSFQPTSTVLNQLQTSFKTLSSTINEIENVDVIYKIGVNRTQNILSDLSVFQNVMSNLAEQIQNAEKPVEARFLQSANDKIRRASESLLSQLSDTVYILTINIYNKFDNIRYKLNKQFCCLQNTLPNSKSFLTELDKNNIFLDTCEKILDIRCNTSEVINSKPKRRYQDGKTKQQKEKVKGEKQIHAAVPDLNHSLNDIKDKMEESDKGFCPSNKSINPTIIGPKLPEDICSSAQTCSLYSEVVAGKIDSHVLNGTVTEKQIIPETHDAPQKNANVTTSSSRVDSVSNHTVDLSNENRTEKSPLEPLSSLDSIVEFLNLFDELPEDNLNQLIKEKRKENSFHSEKKTKSKFKGSGKNYTKNKKGQKNGASKFNKSDFSSTYDKRQSKEKYQPKHVDGDWQFKRSRSRENQRYSSFRDTEDPSNWYFNRARSRKNARDHVDTNDGFSKPDTDSCDWDTGSDEDFSDDWFERKRAKSRKRPSNGQRSSAKNVVNAPHRRNILQTRRH